MNRFQKRRRDKKDFLELFNRLKPGADYHDFHEISCSAPVCALEQLAASDDYKRDLFKFCGIPYNQTYLSYFYEGYNTFAELLALWTYGIRNLMAIDIIMAADKKFLFADEVFDKGMFADYIDDWIYNRAWCSDLTSEQQREKGFLQTCFSFIEKPWMYDQIRDLLTTCSETTSGYIIADFVQHPRKIKFCTNKYTKTYEKDYLFNYFVRNLIDGIVDKIRNEIVLPRIRKEGLTKRVYLDLCEKIFSGFETDELLSSKTKIPYSDGEDKLEWECNKYKFILPKTAGYVYKMNNKIFYNSDDFLDYSATKYEMVEICMKKGLCYKAAIVLTGYTDGSFELQDINLSRKKNNSFTWEDFEILKRWFKEKDIIVSEQILDNNLDLWSCLYR